MQVSNHPTYNQIPIPDNNAELKQGEVYQATIKEKLSANEALIQIRGREQLARFEDGVPSENRVTVQVNGQKEQVINVKTITTENSKAEAQVSSEEKILKSLGLTGKESADLKQAVKILLDKGSPLSKEIVSDLKAFFEKGTGTLDSKIETVKALANKRLEATQPQLRAVHEALHGKPLNQVLSDIAKEIDPEFKLENKVMDSTKTLEQTKPPQTDSGKIVQPQNPSTSTSTVEEGNKLAQQTSSSNEASELVRKTRETVEKEPDLKKAIQQIREAVINNPKIDRELAQKIEKAAAEAEKLQSIGKERLLQALKEVEASLSKNTQPIQTSNPSRPTSAVSNQEIPLSNMIKEISSEVAKAPNIIRSIEKIKEQLINNPKVPKEIVEKLNRAVEEAANLAKQGRITTGRDVLTNALSTAQVEVKTIEGKGSQVVPSDQQKIANQTGGTANTIKGEGQQIHQSVDARPSDIVKEIKAEILRDPNLERALEKVRNQIVNNPKIDREVAQKLDQALKEVGQLKQLGQESTGRERLQQALTKAEVELKQIETRQQPTQPSEPSRQPAQPTQSQPGSTQPVQPTQPGSNTVELRPSDIVKNVKAEAQRDPNLERALEKVRDQIVNNPKVDREVAQKLEQALKEIGQLKQLGQESAGRERLQQALTKAEVELKQIETRQPTAVPSEPSRQPSQATQSQPSDVVKDIKSEVQRDPNLDRALEKVRDQIVTNPKIDREVAQKLEQALKEIGQLKQQGQESTGRERLQQALTKAEVELKQIETRQQPTQPSEPSRQPASTQPDQSTQPDEASKLKESLKQVREQLQTDPDPKKALQKVQEQIVNNKNLDPEVSRNIERLVNQANQLDQAGRERLIKMLQQVEALIKQNASQAKTPDSSANTNQKLQQILNNQQLNMINTEETETEVEQIKLPEIKPSETIKQALQQLSKEANLEEALNQVRKEIAGNPNIDMKTIDKTEKALERATQLQDKGREMAARQHLTKELTDVQQELAKTEPKQPQLQQLTGEQYDVNELLQSMQIQSKDILVTKVTQKLAQATHDFRELKREISKNLDNVHRLIDTFKNNAYPQARQMLETAISKLDNAILKSEMMLFTDMKTEKQLMQASGQLADAKKLLAKGNHAEAGKIVHEVKTLIDKLIFKPTEQKIMHFVNKESMALESRTPERNLLAQYGQTTSGYMNQEPSARQMFEMVRSLGLNHDSDIANSLVFQKNDQSQQQEQQQQQQNLKAALLKLTQGEEASAKVAQQAEQALTNLTGQQLLSKSDASGTLQSMFFNLPMMLGGKPENLQVFVNSKNEGQQVDWENCNLYFLLETRKLGDVGILLNSTDRNLSITVKNDTPRFKERMEPIAALTKEKLQEIGYNVNNIQFTRMNAVASKQVAPDKQESEVKPNRPIFTEKGMDFKI